MKTGLVRRLFCVLAAAAVLFPAATVPAVTGWQIDEIDGDFPGDPVRYYHAGTSVRIENLVLGIAFLVDLEEGNVFIVEDDSARYAGGPFAEVVKELRRHMESRRKSRDAKDADGAEEHASAVMSDLRFEKIPGAQTIGRFAAEGYRVFLGDLLVEEVWLAPEIDVVTAGGGGTLFRMMEGVTGGEGGDNDEFPPVYEREQAYRDLLDGGYAVRRIRYILDIESLTEVVSAERRDLPAELFAVPPGYGKTGWLDLFSGRE